MVGIVKFYDDSYYEVNPTDSTFVNKYKLSGISIDITNNNISHYSNAILCVSCFTV